MKLPRCSGILLHATSLPSKFGIGDFGPEAYRFADQLACAGQSLWQVLPLGPIGYGNSPYQSFSAFAGEPLLISLESLVEEGFLTNKDLTDAPQFPREKVDYQAVARWKIPLLVKAYRSFAKKLPERSLHAFDQFCADQASWLDDYTLFVALKKESGLETSWTQWDNDLVKRNPAAIAKARVNLQDEIDCQKFWQFLFYSQWNALRSYCAERAIKLMGDIPIYVAQESSDVWANPRQFLLNEDGSPKAVSGVPPDYFSETGQRWGNPIYNWKEIEQTGFHWWVERFRGMFRIYDVLRVDHFRGFQAFWEVPANEETAINGQWVKAPGEKLFQAVVSELGELEIVAENLGVITPEVEALRSKFDFPGMAILQFAFGIEGNAADYRPHNLERKVIAYTGTHDNDTVIGWWNHSDTSDTRTTEDVQKEREFTLAYLGPSDEPMNWRMIRAYLASVAQVVVSPMQDILGLGREARMNRPGTAHGNWEWRMLPEAFTDAHQSKLNHLSAIYDRIAKKR